MLSFHLNFTIPTSKLNDEFSEVTSVTLSITCNITLPYNFDAHNKTATEEEQDWHYYSQNKKNDNRAPNIKILVTPFIVRKIPPLNSNPQSLGMVGKIGEPLTGTDLPTVKYYVTPAIDGKIGESTMPIGESNIPTEVGKIRESLPETNLTLALPGDFCTTPTIVGKIGESFPETNLTLAPLGESNIPPIIVGKIGKSFPETNLTLAPPGESKNPPTIVGNIGESFPKTNLTLAPPGESNNPPPIFGNIGVSFPETNPTISQTIVKPPTHPDLSKDPELVSKTRNFLSNSEKNIELCEEGVGGTYFVLDNGRKKFGIFKPTDEEPGSMDNPKKKIEKPLLPPGGGSNREVAAYLIDNGHAGVPETCFIHNLKYKYNGKSLTKSGSIQRFVENDGDSSSMSSSRFLTSDVHNIGILDIRLFNMDRNGENILVKKIGSLYRLVPIDHTYILPPTLDNAWFEWHHWRQAKEPFSPETLQYIASIDIEKDSKVLRSVGIEEECIRTMRFSTFLLKKGAEVGLSLFQIANMVCRKNKNPSELEKLVMQSGMNEEEFQRLVGEVVKMKVEGGL